MLIPFRFIYEKYGMKISGILHVGAHECEELVEYEKVIGRDKIMWIEAIQEKVDLCRSLYPDIQICQMVASDKVEMVKFNVANNGQSSSMLEFGIHSVHHPHVHYVSSVELETQLLSTIDFSYNFINLDIQGAELKALKGLGDKLHHVDYIYTEVNTDYVYKGCNLINELDEYLATYGFKCVEARIYKEYKWGDAFYIKQ
jgi:FkbM family methyltransferase